MLLNFNPFSLLRGFTSSSKEDAIVNSLHKEFPYESRDYVVNLVRQGNIHGVRV